MMTDLVLLEETSTSAKLTLNRPERHNALVPKLLADLNRHLAHLARRTDLRFVALTSKGASFSTGGDVKAFWEEDDRKTYAHELVGALNEAILALIALPCPVLANIHGPITGGSVGLMLAADLVVITHNTFVQPYYSVVGFAPDGGWTALMPDRIGLHRTGRILTLNERLNADDLMSLGLADAITNDPDTQLTAWQKQIETMVPCSLHATQHLLKHGKLDQYRTGLERERQAFVERITKPEVTEGMRTFLALLD